jgi:hypothetical protein
MDKLMDDAWNLFEPYYGRESRSLGLGIHLGPECKHRYDHTLQLHQNLALATQ